MKHSDKAQAQRINRSRRRWLAGKLHALVGVIDAEAAAEDLEAQQDRCALEWRAAQQEAVA